MILRILNRLLLICATFYVPLEAAPESIFGNHGTAEARVRGGGTRGGARVAAKTTVRPGQGVTRSVTASTRYHRPAPLPAVRPVVSAPGAALRTTRRVARRTAYRTATGVQYYYGAPVYTQPVSCTTVFWEGIYVQNCNGIRYVAQVENGVTVYYPLEI